MSQLFEIYLIFLISMSFILFCMMWSDKRRAQKHKFRISEKTLFIFAALGGAMGGILGMRTFRHKTKHWYFVVGFWALALLQLAFALYWFWTIVR